MLVQSKHTENLKITKTLHASSQGQNLNSSKVLQVEEINFIKNAKY